MSAKKQTGESEGKTSFPPWMTWGGVAMAGAFLVALALMYYPTPTRISLETGISRAEMTLGIFPTQRILNSLEVETISFGQFSKIELHPSSLVVADPGHYEMETDSFTAEAWQPLTMFGYVRFSPKPQGATVTLLPEDKTGKILGVLDPIHVREESHVVFEMDRNDPRTVRMRFLGPETRVIFTPTHAFEIIADEAKVDGIKDFPFGEEPSLTFRPELPEHRSKIEIQGTERHLTLTLKVSPSSMNQLFAEEPITVKTIDFSRLNSEGKRVTAMVTPAVLSYPDFPDIPTKTIPSSDFVSITPKKVMTIKQMKLLPDKPGLVVFLDGTAKHIQSGSAEFSIDHRLSKFEELWNNAKVKLLVELWKEIK